MQKTITTFLIDGTLEGVQNIFDESGTCELFLIPRTHLAYTKEEEQLDLPALYILLGQDEALNTLAYIGETGSPRQRLKHHDTTKEFWDKALVFVSKNATINRANVQYLEYLALKQAKESNRYILNENKQAPKCPHLAKHHRAPIDRIFEEIKFLAEFAGVPIFSNPLSKTITPAVTEPITIQPKTTIIEDDNDKHWFYCKRRGANLKGFFTPPSTFTIVHGSLIATKPTKSFRASPKYNQFLQEYTTPCGDSLKISKDYTANSPSTAAEYGIASSANGWDEWKDADGKTLSEVYRPELHLSPTIKESQYPPAFYIKGRGADAKGYYLADEKAMVILKGSIIAPNITPSYAKEKSSKNRIAFIASHTSTENGLLYVNEDYKAKSPSEAANFCVGTSLNGWIVWKDAEGKTLDELCRQTTSETT